MLVYFNISCEAKNVWKPFHAKTTLLYFWVNAQFMLFLAELHVTYVLSRLFRTELPLVPQKILPSSGGQQMSTFNESKCGCVNEGPYECSPIYHKPTFYIWNQEVTIQILVQNQLHPLIIKAETYWSEIRPLPRKQLYRACVQQLSTVIHISDH